MAMDWHIDIKSYLGPRRFERCLSVTEAAIKCFAERGLAETSVGLITDTAKVQRTQFYFFYENKTDCFTACHRLCLAELETRIGEAVADAPSWQERVRFAISGALDTFSSNPYLARLVLFEAELVGSEADKKIRQAAYHNLAKALMAIFKEAAAPDTEVTPLMASMAIGSVRTVLMQALEETEPEDIHQIAPDLFIAVMAVSIGPQEARRLSEAHVNF